jgi:hypothetical protein
VTLEARGAVVIGPASADAAALQLDAGTVALERVVVEDVRGAGIAVRAESASLVDVVVRRAGGPGVGVTAATGALGPLRVTGTAGLVVGDGSYVVRDVHVDGASEVGFAAEASALDVERLEVVGAALVGVALGGSRGTLRDVRVRDGAPVEARTGTGGGISVERGSAITLERARVERTFTFGIAVVEADLSGADLSVRDVGPHPASGGGYGIVAAVGATAHLSRIAAEHVSTVAIFADDATMDLEDLDVRATHAPDGVDGVGLAVVQRTLAASLDVERATIVDATRWAVFAGGAATLRATHLDVREVGMAPCASTSCPGSAGGIGVVAYEGADAALVDLTVQDAELAGLAATAEVHVLVSGAILRRNAVGLVVSPSLAINLGATPGIDLMDVELLDNEIAQQVTDLTIPPPILAPIDPGG